jgi:transcriptional regulator with XRE-family HTH domain
MDWVEKLTEERRINGQPTLREMSAATGVPFQTIGNWFAGSSLPNIESLRRLLISFSKTTRERAMDIEDAVIEARNDRWVRRDKPPRHVEPQRQSEMAELSVAIRELTDEIRAWRKESQPEHDHH